MLLEFYVEEPSAEAALIHLVPRILLHQTFEFEIYTFQGKSDLLRKLPNRLKAYRYWQREDWCVLVLVDRDSEDCRQLKHKPEGFARDAGLITPAIKQPANRLQVINRIAIEELEAWFCGDVEAIRTAYPRIPANLGQQAPYREPDAIKGGTWEKLEQILQY